MKEKFYQLYDMVVYITNNYSKMPDEFKSKFPEKDIVSSRLFISDITNLFDDYEK